MELTKEQAKLLIDLAGQIQTHYGLIIGYSTPTIPLPSTKEADFIIFEHPDLGEIQCFYKDDIEQRPMGPYLVQVLPQDPEHDEEVENLLNKLNQDLLDGKIWFDPSASRELDGEMVEVIRKEFGKVEVFDTNVFTERYGYVYTYDIVCSLAQDDKKFAVVKELIDENWPRPEPEKPKSSPQDILGRILRLFGF